MTETDTERQARQAHERFLVNQICPGLMDAIESYQRALQDALDANRDGRAAWAALIANDPLKRLEWAVAILEMPRSELKRAHTEDPQHFDYLMKRIADLAEICVSGPDAF